MPDSAPPRPATRLDYGRRIARAMALVAADPARTVPLEELAAAAAFSPFHFHRIYRELAGETPVGTQARARLTLGARLLLEGAAPVAAVARAAGYGSAAAFTRAFRAAHGIPPAAYRAARGIGTPRPPAAGTAPRPDREPDPEETTMFEVTIRTEPALHLAALAHRGAYGAMGATFDRLGAWAAARGLLRADSRFLGLYHDDPMTVPEAGLRSDACITVPPGTAPAEGVRLLDLPAARVAVLLFRGPYAELEPAYSWLYRDWLPASGEEPADQPPREEYLNDPRSLPPAEWLTAVMLPLRDRPPGRGAPVTAGSPGPGA